MSIANDIKRQREDNDELSLPLVGVPADFAARYRITTVPGYGQDRAHIGLFARGSNQEPVIEIGPDRIRARSQDVAVIRDLVALAQHNGWTSLEVAGTDEFRRGLWLEARQNGLDVRGYEPSFEERRLAAEREAERQAQELRQAERARQLSPDDPGHPAGTAPGDELLRQEGEVSQEAARLAKLLRSADAAAIGVEPGLTGAADAMTLAKRYFEAAAERSGEVAGVEPALTEFRELLAGAIELGQPVALRPEYQPHLAMPTWALVREPAPEMSRTMDFER